MADEGAGATLTFGTSGTSLDIVSIQPGGVSRESLDMTHHGTTGGAKVFQPGDFHDPGTIQVTYLTDPNVRPPFQAAKETITVTYPVPSGKNNGATEAADGFVTDWDNPDMQIDQRMESTITIKRSGVITFTTSST